MLKIYLGPSKAFIIIHKPTETLKTTHGQSSFTNSSPKKKSHAFKWKTFDFHLCMFAFLR